MAPRRIAALALTLLALVLTGCATHGAGAVVSWRAPANGSGQGAGGAAFAPTARPRPTGSTPGGVPQPSPQSSPGPSAPAGGPSRTPGPTTSSRPLGLITTTGSRAVALTFDDGPGPYTEQMLDLLDRYHVKATFCLIGRQVHAYQEAVRRMVADGMTLCNHTWDHDEMLRYRSDEVIREELARTNDAIHAIVPGAKIEYFRNPGGAFGQNTVAIARSLGMRPLMWNVDPRDWTSPGTQAIISNVLNHTRAGSIVLSHDGGGVRTQTLAAYQVIIPTLRGRFRLVPMPVA